MGCAASSAKKTKGGRKLFAMPLRTPSGSELLAAATLEKIAAASGFTVLELAEYAEFMAVDAAAEPHLLGIVAEAMSAPLPTQWMEAEDPASGQYYYCNVRTHETTWDHPLDQYYKNKLETAQARARSLDPASTGSLTIPTATRPSATALPLRELSGDTSSSKLPTSKALWEYEEPLWETKGAAAGTAETIWVQMQAGAAADLEAAFTNKKMGKMVVLQRRGHSGLPHSYIVCLREPMIQMNSRTGNARRIRRTEHGPPVVIAVPVAMAIAEIVTAVDAGSSGVVVQSDPPDDALVLTLS